MEPGEQAASSLGVELKHLKFYEGELADEDYIPPFEEPDFLNEDINSILQYSHSKYRVRFLQEKTRYVNVELCLNNLFYEQRDQEFHLHVRYYNPDGSLAWENPRAEVLPSSEEYFFETMGCGWKEPGNWVLGEYRIEIFIDGVKITESKFYIFMRIDITMDMFGWSVAHLGWAKGEYKEEIMTYVLDTDFVTSIEACTLTDVPTTVVTCKDRMVLILYGTPEEVRKKLHLQK